MKKIRLRSMFLSFEKTNLRTLLFLLITVLTLSSVNGQIGRFKAVYIFNISRYVEWKASPNFENFVIGVYGEDAELISELKRIGASKSVENKPIKIVVLSSVSEVSGCNIVFVTSKESNMLPQISSFGKKGSTLVISESNDGISKGAVMNFVLNGNKLAYELKSSNANLKNLNISSSLESLAIKTY